MEKLRDLKHNFAVDYHNNKRRWQNTIENERGGLFDRAENQGVKRQIFIPGIDFN
jgi:hypothetical protein